MAQAQAWTPHESLTHAPTNLKEAIDWVLRVTGRDGKKNDKAAAQSPPSTSSPPHCLCYLAKAVKDLLYDARSPGSPGPSTERYWDNILLKEESTIAQPVLTDLGLLNGGSTSAASSTCAGGTEVIGTLIEQLAQGLQKWVGWRNQGDECCLKGESGIGKKCDCNGGGGGAGCCNGASGTCNCNSAGKNCCYKSAYKKESALWTNIVNGTTGAGGSGSAGSAVGSADLVKAAQDVHLLARIFLGSVCLIWSGLSQLGFLTGGNSGTDQRWKDDTLSDVEKGLGSFMAAMGYDLERLNGSGGTGGQKGEFVWKLLSGQEPNGTKAIQWQEFKNGDANKDSVAEYYSSIYSKTQGAAKSTSETLCKQYPLLVLHILASGYFRAGSAGAKNVILAPKAAPKKEETPSPRKPRTIREILYWLSALPYSQGYKTLVERMQQKTDQVTNGNEEKDKDKIELHSEGVNKTDLYKDKITHYLMAACGYCPLVLIGIQGTIATSGTDPAAASGVPGGVAGADQNKCPNHKEDRNYRCNPDEIGKQQAPATPQASAASAGKPLEKGEVCYGGYHLEVSQFGPLHGMYANGLFGFQMDLSAAQCLDQLRVYVYHCFYQLYFLRKQCSAGAIAAAGGTAVLGWKSCRYGFQVSTRKAGVSSGGADNKNWKCKPLENGGNSNDNQGGSPNQNNGQKCNCLGKGASQGGHGSNDGSPLQSFLCDSITGMHCHHTVGSGVESYPPIEEHMNKIVTPSGQEKGPHKHYPELCPVPMGWSTDKENHFKDLTKTHKTAELEPKGNTGKYPAHCTGRTLSYLLEYYCDPEKSQQGTLVVLLRLLACITPTVPRTLGDLFGFYYYIVYIGGKSSGGAGQGVHEKLKGKEGELLLYMGKDNAVVGALTTWNGDSSSGAGCSHKPEGGSLKTLYGCKDGNNQCCPYLSPLSGQQYGQLSPAMAGTYLSWLVYLIEHFEGGLDKLKDDYMKVDCKGDGCTGVAGNGCGNGTCTRGTHGNPCSTGGSGSSGVCKCTSVVSCTGVLPVLYKYGFGYGNVEALHKTGGTPKKCDAFLTTLKGVLKGEHIKHNGSGLHHEINQLIYTTRLPWIFVLTIAWLVAVLYLAFGAIWPLDWTHMRSHCRGWFRKGSLSPWEILMVGKKKGRGILEFFGGR